jgi:hypothetical protein
MKSAERSGAVTERSEGNREAVDGSVQWAGQDSNLGPTDYECRPKA